IVEPVHLIGNTISIIDRGPRFIKQVPLLSYSAAARFRILIDRRNFINCEKQNRKRQIHDNKQHNCIGCDQINIFVYRIVPAGFQLELPLVKCYEQSATAKRTCSPKSFSTSRGRGTGASFSKWHAVATWPH